MPLVLHLNGAPGVGKSTLARLWADRHPGTLLLDIDALRTWVSGWRDDFAATGATVRPVALAMLAAYVAQGRDVVLPQLIASETELARFESAAPRDKAPDHHRRRRSGLHSAGGGRRLTSR